jgi:hypothetical protein
MPDKPQLNVQEKKVLVVRAASRVRTHVFQISRIFQGSEGLGDLLGKVALLDSFLVALIHVVTCLSKIGLNKDVCAFVSASFGRVVSCFFFFFFVSFIF